MVLQLIYVALPHQEARRQILHSGLKDQGVDLDDADYAEMARQTNGLSASDLSNVVQEVLNSDLQLLDKATHFRLDPYAAVASLLCSALQGTDRSPSDS